MVAYVPALGGRIGTRRARIADRMTGQANIAEQALLRWRSVPARRSVKTTGLVLVMILGVPAGLFFWHGPFFGLLGLVILGGSMMPFFLPTHYWFTDRAVHKRYLGIAQRRAWAEFRSSYPDANGVLLSPFARPSRLENFRGLYVRFENNREAVLAIVNDKVKPARVGEIA